MEARVRTLESYFPSVIANIISQFLAYKTFAIGPGCVYPSPPFLYEWNDGELQKGIVVCPPLISQGKLTSKYPFIYKTHPTFLYMINVQRNHDHFYMQQVQEEQCFNLFSIPHLGQTFIQGVYEMEDILMIFLTFQDNSDRTLCLRYSVIMHALLEQSCWMDFNVSTFPWFCFFRPHGSIDNPTSHPFFAQFMYGLQCFTRAQDSWTTLYLIYALESADNVRTLMVWKKDVGNQCIPIQFPTYCNWSSMCAVNIASKLYIFTTCHFFILERLGPADDVYAPWKQEPHEMMPAFFSPSTEKEKLLPLVQGNKISFIVESVLYTYDTTAGKWCVIPLKQNWPITGVISEQEGGSLNETQ
jgi:hypothetical protein